MAFQVNILPAFQDNYIFLLCDPLKGTTIAIDPGQATPVINFLERKVSPLPPRQPTSFTNGKNHRRLDAILLTHHHLDHVGGVSQLQAKYHCKVYGFEPDCYRLPPITHSLNDKDQISMGDSTCQVLFIPGHTLGHIAYWFSQEKMLFSGDTLFSLGCGRLFEGSPKQMWASLQTIMSLPDDTQIFFAHEYTQSNGRFALQMDSSNRELADFLQEVKILRHQGKFTVPTLLSREKKLNPFLRPLDPQILRSLDCQTTDPVAAFARLRAQKDTFQ